MSVMTGRQSAVICALALAVPAGVGQATQSDTTFSVDVVADCNRFISEGVGHPHPGPVFGDYFMQEGLIYEDGTLTAKCEGGDGCGLNEDGTPEFPEAVIGKWTCYGSFVGKGGATAQGVWLYSTQVYEFDVEQIEPNVFAPGEHSLVSIGTERNDLDVPWNRAITGSHPANSSTRAVRSSRPRSASIRPSARTSPSDFEIRPIGTPVSRARREYGAGRQPRPASCPDLNNGRPSGEA